MSTSEEAFRLGRVFAGSSPDRLAEAINDALKGFIGDHFKSASGYLLDREGKRSEHFAVVVYEASAHVNSSTLQAVPADAAAAVVDVSDELDLESFRAAYARIANAKTLKKTAIARGQVKTNITLGIILAARSSVPLEQIGEELDRLNSNTPSSQWPDMIAISSTGVINYGVQFPGESVSGDFLPPAEGALSNYVPSLYVVIVMRPTGMHTFNKMFAFLVGHLVFFARSKAPTMAEDFEGAPKKAVTLTGFQYNLNGELLPVPRRYYNDRYLPPRPLLIQDRQGNVLSTIEYMPWQDGGIILLRGTLPLEGLLVFLGKDALRGGIIKRPNLQISHVLPITPADFNEFLKRLQRQSNIVIRNEPGRFVVQKLADEGASSPFMARIFLGILRLRDAVFPDFNYARRIRQVV